MAKITITEALAEIKTVEKRIAKKREFVKAFLARQDMIKDPLEKDGGSFAAIQRERQAIRDLGERRVALRQSISDANRATEVTLDSDTRSIAAWLVWRREVAPGAQQFLGELRAALNNYRTDAQKKGLAVVSGAEGAQKPTDIVVNINESKLAEEIEHMETVLGSLDGILSLKNATITVEV